MKIQSLITHLALLGIGATTPTPRRPAVHITDTNTTFVDDGLTTAAIHDAILNMSSNNTLIEKSVVLARDSDKIAYWDLPECYRKCFEHAAFDTPEGTDIRELTTEEFCHTKWDSIGRLWTDNHWFRCANEQCKACQVIPVGCGTLTKKWAIKNCEYMGTNPPMRGPLPGMPGINN